MLKVTNQNWKGCRSIIHGNPGKHAHVKQARCFDTKHNRIIQLWITKTFGCQDSG